MSAPDESQCVITLQSNSNLEYVGTRFPLNIPSVDDVSTEYTRKDIGDSISLSQHYLNLIEADIEYLGRLQMQYEAAKVHVKNYIKFQKSALSPIKKLPMEILGRIFIECAGFISIHDTCVWRLCRVCRSWRQLAISLPDLWCNISLKSHRSISLDKQSRKIASILELCISRSAPYPLTLEIYIDEPMLPIDPLLKVSDRWRSVKFSWISNTWEGHTGTIQSLSLLSSICGRLPKLQHLKLEGCSALSPEDLQPFSDASELTHFEWLHAGGDHFNIDIWNGWSYQRLKGGFPWNQITHLTIQIPLPLSVYITLMNLLTHVNTLIIPKVFNDRDAWDEGPFTGFSLGQVEVTQHPDLQKLSITGYIADHLLAVLAAPHLAELCLHTGAWYDERFEQVAQSLSVYFRKYVCALRTLHITGHLAVPFLKNLFAVTPTVETLYLLSEDQYGHCSLEDEGGFKATCRILTYTFDTHDVTILPNLQGLYLGNMPLADLGSVIDLIRSRNDLAPKIAEREKIPSACVPVRRLKILKGEIWAWDSDKDILWYESWGWQDTEVTHDETYSSLLKMGSGPARVNWGS